MQTGEAFFAFLLHQADAVVVRLFSDQLLVIFEQSMTQSNHKVVRLLEDLLEGNVRDALYLSVLGERLAGDNVDTLLLKNVAELDGRGLAQIVNIRLVGQAEHADRIRDLLHLGNDLAGNKDRLVLVALAGSEDDLGLRRELLVDEPRVDRDAVTADADARGQDIDARMAVGELDELEYVDAHLVADDGQLVRVSDVDVAEGILGQLAHLGGQVVGLVYDALCRGPFS